MSTLPYGPITRVIGTGLVLRGDDIDTDRIMPARFLRVLTFEGLGDHVFEDDRADEARRGRRHPFDDPARAGAALLFVNGNFGCGSSREHAPQGLLRRGVRAIVGESFSEIFFGNAAMLGMPCVVVERRQAAALMEIVDREPDRAVTLDLETLQVGLGDVTAPVALPEALRAAFLGGAWAATAQLLERFEEVRRVASGLPYLAGWDG
jgi:3-isopropylmalate/(R)-2-methylmalate dehydratase small subunit